MRQIGPHIGTQYAWPLSRLIQAMTSDDDGEISDCLDAVLSTAKLGLIHESVNVNRVQDYTRSWFACKSLLPHTMQIVSN